MQATLKTNMEQDVQEKQYISKISETMTDGRLSDAQALIESAVSEYPTSGFIHFLKAAIFAQEQNYEAAISTYQQALQHSPDLLIARFQLGLLLASLEQVEDAVTHLQALLGAEHEYLPLFANGIINVFQGENESAILSIEEGLTRNTDNPNLNKDMREMLARIKADGADDEQTPPMVEAEETQLSTTNEERSDKSHLLDIYDIKR